MTQKRKMESMTDTEETMTVADYCEWIGMPLDIFVDKMEQIHGKNFASAGLPFPQSLAYVPYAWTKTATRSLSYLESISGLIYDDVEEDLAKCDNA